MWGGRGVGVAYRLLDGGVGEESALKSVDEPACEKAEEDAGKDVAWIVVAEIYTGVAGEGGPEV